MPEKMAPEPGTTFPEVFPTLNPELKGLLMDVFQPEDLLTLKTSHQLIPDQVGQVWLVTKVYNLLVNKDPSHLNDFLSFRENRKVLSEAQKGVFAIIHQEKETQFVTPLLYAPGYQDPEVVEKQLANLKTPIQKLHFIATIVEVAIVAI